MIHPALTESETAPPAPTAQRSLSSSRHVRTNLDANCSGAPNSEQLTAYDKAHLVIKLRLLDADAARADCRLLPGWSCHSIPPQIFDPAQLVYDALWREHAG